MSIQAVPKNASAPQAENPAITLSALFAMLNKALQEGVKAQGEAAIDITQALRHVAEQIGKVNDSMADTMKEINEANDMIKTLKPYMIGLAIAGTVLGMIGPAIGGTIALMAGAAEAVGATTASIGGALAGIGGGIAGVVNGAYTLQLANCLAELAVKNGAMSSMTGAQQTYQGIGKWATSEIGQTFSRQNSIAQSVSSGIKEMNDGQREAAREILSGSLKG